MSASLAGVSLRVSKAFVEATPKATKVLNADNLRLWAEMGRKLAMANADAGIKFFSEGVSKFKKIPTKSRSLVFQICQRQLLLSSSIALETYEFIPELAGEIDDDELFTEILGVAGEVANRSAKHSADFLRNTPKVAEAVRNNREMQKLFWIWLPICFANGRDDC